MQLLKIRKMTDEAIKAASDADRLYLRLQFKRGRKVDVVARPYKVVDDCSCNPDEIFSFCACRTIKYTKAMISHGKLYLLALSGE